MSFIKQDGIPIIKWNPLNLSLHNDFHKINGNSIKYNNEIEFNIYDCFKNFKDFKINQSSAVVLTNLLKDTEIYDINKTFYTELIDENEPYVETVLTTWDNRLVSIKLTATEQKLIINYQKAPVLFEQTDVLKLIFESESIVKIKNQDNLFLIEKNNELVFEPKSLNADLNRFNYIKGTDHIYLFKYGTDYTYAMIPKLNEENFEVILTFNEYYGYDRQGSFLQYFKFKMLLPPSNSIQKNNNFIYNTKDVKYNAPANNRPISSVTEGYQHNFLIHFPTTNQNSKTETIKLKNIHNNTYEYSDSNTIRFDLPRGTNRIYDRIVSGSNEVGEHENIFLNYRANTIIENFKSDESTSFYYNAFVNETHVQFAGFIEDGALQGDSPEYSDCILIQNTSTQDQFVPYLEVTDKSTYTWFCTWLYFDKEEQKSIWMDRYYNSATYSNTEALSGKYLEYIRENGSDLPYYDVISNLILKPGVKYIYKRNGKKNIKNILDHSGKNIKILETGKWNEKHISDLTGITNSGVFYESSSVNRNEFYYDLNGSNHIIFSSSPLIKNNNELTFSVWLYAEDWTNIQGYQLLGNYYNGGIGLINEAASVAPLFTLVDATSGFISHFNYKMKSPGPFVSFKLPNNLLNNENGILGDIITIRMPDYTYWIFDAYNLIAHKYDANDAFLNKISTENNILGIEYINQIEINSKSELFLYDDENKKIIKLNQDGKYLETILIDDENIKGFQIDLNDNIVYSAGHKSVIDNNNCLWEAKGINLYKNKRVCANLGAIHALTCDYLNNIWVLHGDDLLTVINADTNNITNDIQGVHVFNRENVFVDKCSNQYANEKRKKYINFIRIPSQSREIYKECKKNTILDLAVVIDGNTNLLSLIDLNLNQYHKVKLDDFYLFNQGARIYAEGDFSNYQFQRKFANNLLEKNISWLAKLNSPGGYNQYDLRLKYNIEKLSSGWHHFAFSINCARGEANYFLDGKEIHQVIFDSGKYHIDFNYKSPLLIGATAIANKTLKEVIGLNEKYEFIGKITDLQIYKESLNSDYIKSIYMSSKNSPEIENLMWNQQTGERNFIEQITGWIKFKIPGIKSKYFNINIQNMKIVDEKIKLEIVQSIRNNINNLIPAHTQLHEIIWS